MQAVLFEGRWRSNLRIGGAPVVRVAPEFAGLLLLWEMGYSISSGVLQKTVDGTVSAGDASDMQNQSFRL